MNPNDIKIQYFNNKRNKWTTKVKPKIYEFKVRLKYPSWEPIDYYVLGGMVFMDLTLNHLEEDEDEESYAGPHCIHLANHISDTLSMQPIVVVTHIELQSHVSNQKNLTAFDRIIRINNKKVKSVYDIKRIMENMEDEYIKIETQDDKHTFCLKALKKQEVKDSLKRKYPVEKLTLVKKKRRYV